MFALLWIYYSFWWTHVNHVPLFFRVACESCTHIFFRLASLALGQSYDCSSASEVTLKDMGKISWYPTTTKHNKVQTVYLTLGMSSRSLVMFDMENLFPVPPKYNFKCSGTTLPAAKVIVRQEISMYPYFSGLFGKHTPTFFRVTSLALCQWSDPERYGQNKFIANPN